MTAAAILTKATSYALVLPVILAIGLGLWLRPPGERRSALRPLAIAGLPLVLPVLGWLALSRALGRSGINTVGGARHPASVTEFLSYLWQFYLPRLPFMARFRTTPQLPVYDIWLRQGTGEFGWLVVDLPNWIYKVAGIVVAAVGIATVGLIARLRGRRQLALLAFFAVALVALLGLLHVTEYRAVIAGSSGFSQGRYLLPAAGLWGLAFGLIVSRIPRRWCAPACGLLVTTMLAFQVVALSTVMTSYYL